MSYGYPVASPTRIVGSSAGLLLTDGNFQTEFQSSLSLSSDVVIVLPSSQGLSGEELVKTVGGTAFISPPTMVSVGGGVELPNDPNPKNYVLKSFVAGNEIALVSHPTYIEVINTSPISDITFSSAGGDYAFVDGTSSGEFKGLEAGSGIELINSSTNIIIKNTSLSSIVTLGPSTPDNLSLVNPASANPNFIVKSIVSDVPTLQIVDNGTFFSIEKVLGFASVVVMLDDMSQGGTYSNNGWKNVDFNAIETNQSNANVLFTLDTTPGVSGLDIINTTAYTQVYWIDAWISKAHETSRQALMIVSGTDPIPNVVAESFGMQSCTEIGYYSFVVNITGTVVPNPLNSSFVIGIPGFPLLLPSPFLLYENSIQVRQSARVSVEPFSTKRIRLNTNVQLSGKKYARSPGSNDWYGPDQQVTGGYNLLGNPSEPVILGWMRALQLS